MALPATRLAVGRAPKIAGLLIGAALGIGGWMYLSNDTDVSLAAPAPAAPASNVAGLAPNVASEVQGLAPNAAPAPEIPESKVSGLAPNVALAAATESSDRGQPSKIAVTRARYERGQPPEAAAPQRPRYVGTLSIDASPGGQVFLNRQPAGQTPVRLTDLRAGSHLIWVEREGYRRWTRVVQVPADRVTRLSAELEPLAQR